MVRIADIGTLRVYVYVPEEETSLITRGHARHAPPARVSGAEFTGTVARFATALDLSTRTMLTEVDLDNPSHELYPGMYADVTLELERHRERAAGFPRPRSGRRATRGSCTSCATASWRSCR